MSRLERLGEGGLDPIAKLIDPVAGRRGDHDRVTLSDQQLTDRVVIEQIGLVVDEQARRGAGTDLLEHGVDGGDRLGALRGGLGGIDDVDDEVGERGLLERRLECLD